MKTEYQNLKVSSPAPGHYIIEGLPAGNVETEEGRLVLPTSVHIPPALPSALLLDLVEARGDLALQKLVQIEAEAEVEPVSVKDSTALEVVEPTGAGDFSEPLPRILGALADAGGTLRIKELAEAAGVEVETIKVLSGQGFEVGQAGWVKLKDEGGEA